MASEITVQVSLTVNKGFLQQQKSASFQPTMSGSHYSAAAQNILTTAGGTQLTIDTADVATLGIAWFRNTDATNFVTIGIKISGTFYPVIKIKAGEAYPLRLVPGVTYWALADTGAVALEWFVAED